MPTQSTHLISLNGKYLASYENGNMYAPLRVSESVIKNIENAIAVNGTPNDSCVVNIASTLDNGKVLLATEFHKATKCTAGLNCPTTRTKTDMCIKNLCTGKCNDEFMCNTVAKYILPELHKGKQK